VRTKGTCVKEILKMTIPLNIQTGVEQAWEQLKSLKYEEVCCRAKVLYDKSLNTYILNSFGHNINITLLNKDINSDFQESDFYLKNLGDYSKLSILWYLVSAKNIVPSNKMVRPADLRGGGIYSKGSHVLPLDRIADKYGNDIEGFLQRGNELGCEELDYGDASIKLSPFPRVPITIIIWKGDDEFPARSDLLFDATCELHLPVDIIWSTAMMTVLMMLK
jgi:hypothetical protein